LRIRRPTRIRATSSDQREFRRQFHGKMSVLCDGASTAKSASRERGRARPKTIRLRGGFGGDLRPNELTQTAFAADEYLKARARLLRAQFQPGRPHRSFAGFAHRAIGKDCVLHGHNNVTDRFSRLSYHTLRSPVRFREFPIWRTFAAARWFHLYWAIFVARCTNNRLRGMRFQGTRRGASTLSQPRN
jgi:hypothetical protein